MTTQPNLSSTARGCLGLRVQDGNTGVQAEPAGPRPEVASINIYANSPGATASSARAGGNPSESGQDASLRAGREASGQSETDPTINIEKGDEERQEQNKTPPINDEETQSEITTDNEDTNELRKQRKKIWSKLGKKQGIRVATLNIHGRQFADHGTKYKILTTLIRKNKIALLAIQETRLNEELTEELNRNNPRIEIINNGKSTNKEGVAFVVNKDLLGTTEWKHSVVVEGRVSRLQMEWKEGNKIDLVNVYAPNKVKDQVLFYDELKKKLRLEKDMTEPTILGDFNFVEDAIDRIPHRQDNWHVHKEFNKIKKKYNLIDGWRVSNPNRKEYTFYQEGTGSKSRIDRIYINKELYKFTDKWDTLSSAKLSDHDIAWVEILRKNQPYVGKGMWRLQEDLIEFEGFRKKARTIMKEAEVEMETYKELTFLQPQQEVERHRETLNPQKTWVRMKEKLQIEAIEQSKQRKKDLEKKTKDIRKKMKELMKEVNQENNINEQKAKELDKLRNKLGDLEKSNIEKLKQRTEARYRSMGEKCTRYWFNLNKTKKEKECIMALENDKGSLKTKTKEMVEIASLYHEKLQAKPEWNETREKATNEILELVDKRLEEEEIEILENEITENEVRKALKTAKNGKSPGCDGISYEFWKSWTIEEKKRKENDPDIIGMMTTLYKDIEENGIKEKILTKAAMSLLYKKKDKRRIENYRPLALLNTDYKVYTKVIAKRLGKVVQKIIDPDQAGFIPGRGLYDHTRTTQAAIEYCELKGLDGCIVSLDQEKAYDKIDHEYLWRTLRKYKIPEKIIRIVQTLYSEAETSVYVNNVEGRPIKIRRGVRQGDPMSCLVYNIAIEPLANAIRKSKMKGIEIPGIEKKLLVSLFADDTLVYMNKKDKIKDLKQTIDKFCSASTAKFNLEKTEYLVIGNERYRKEAIEQKKFGKNKLNKEEKMIQEGEAMRTLGAWVGNNSNTEKQWNKILEDQQKILDVWGRMHLSFKGKELVLKALVQSKALFLATVNGMPKHIRKKMKKQMKDFVWNGKERGEMNWETMIKDRTQGGQGMPDLETRLEAIQIVWLKRWLSPPNKRPIWAYITDAIITENTAKEPIVDNESKVQWILQTWHESMSVKSKISQNIKELLRVARKYNAGLEAPKLSLNIKEELPVWHHMAVSENYLWNKPAARCLRNNHGIRTVGEMVKFLKTNTRLVINKVKNCQVNAKCKAIAKKIIELLPGKFNPEKQTPVKDNLDHTPRRIQRNKEEEMKLFNPDITEKKEIMDAIRIFRKRNPYKIRRRKEKEPIIKPAYRTKGKDTPRKIVLYTDGSADKNGAENASTGIGVYHEENSNYNQSKKLEKKIKSNQAAELMAVIAAVESEKHEELLVITDSETTIKGIIERLQDWEDIGWIDIKNKEEWQYLAYLLRARTAKTSFKWTKGHAGTEGNEKADELAEIGKQSDNYYKPDLRINAKFVIDGARLQQLTQKKTYRHLIKRKDKGDLTERTKQNIENIMDEVERITSHQPTQEMIFERLYKSEILNRIKDFIWKIIHNRLKCGRFFQHIPGLEERQYCTCRQIESIDHILFHCEENGAGELWNEIGLIWRQITRKEWIKPTIGILGGLGTVQLRENEKTLASETSLYRILVSEASWTIWKERNKRIFIQKEMNKETLLNSWTQVIRQRATLEYEKIKIEKYEKRTAMKDKYERLWCKNKIIAEIENNNLRINI